MSNEDLKSAAPEGAAQPPAPTPSAPIASSTPASAPVESSAPPAAPPVPVAPPPPPQAASSDPAVVTQSDRREELYPRADAPTEADRDVPQEISRRSEEPSAADDGADDDEGDDADEVENGADDGADDDGADDDGADQGEAPQTGAAVAEPGAPAPGQPAQPGQPQQGQAGQPGQPGREGGRRRRRRRRGRGGRGGERGEGPQQQGQGQQPPREGQPQPEGGQERKDEGREQRRDGGRREGGRRDGRDGREHGRERGEQRGERRDGGRRDGRGGEERHSRQNDERRDGRHREDRREERSNAPRGQRPPVKREVLANTSFEETRIAILENGRLAELHWERKSSQNIVGNIYKGTVENVLPGISSAFVNIGFEKNAYLYISDVLGDKNAPIDQTLKKGQQIMIQVAKEAISTKGPKVSMDVSLPGRYLVFTPFQQYVGISKHIAEPEERQRLERIMDRLVAGPLAGKGVVVRTEAEGASEEELEREVKYLLALWQQIQKKMDEQPSPALLHQDLGLALQIARDILSEQVYVYMLDNKEVHAEVVQFVDGFAPELKDRIKLYDAKTPIFKAFGLEKHLESIRETKVPLPNGGSIVIQEAESLCAIDVNTGRFTGSKSQEETVTQTNIEAAQEVAHQIRLRNIGGIIVVDFIDMRKASNRQKVMEAFAEACRADRAKIRILPITRLGLIELTRERKRMSTAALLTAECPQCRGSGRVLSTETLRIKIQREIFEMTGGRPGGSIRVHLAPAVAEAFRTMHAIIEKNVQRAVRVQTDANLSWEDYRIVLE